MSVFDVIDQHGPWKLAGFLTAVAVFLVLHLLRWPLALAARLLLAAQSGLDRRLTTVMTPDSADRVRRPADV